MFEAQQRALEQQIRRLLEAEGVPLPERFSYVEIPFRGTWGFGLPMFPLAAAEIRAKGLKVPVPQRAQELAEKLAEALGTPPGFRQVEAVRGYLNFYLDPYLYSREIIDRVLTEGARYGHHPRRGERVMVEFSQPNTHKALHVGHLRGTILGDVVCRILDAAGYDVIRANYLGDIGWHVMKWLWNYLKFHNGEEPPEEDKIRWMGQIYVEATKRLEEHPEWEAEVRELFRRWDQGDPELRALWEKTRQWSIEGFEQIYRLLNVSFDRVYYESEVEEPGKRLVETLIERGIAVDQRPEGPVIVPLDELLGLKKETYRTYVVLRSDGTSLYSTKDLALAIQKFEEYPDLARSIYVVDVRQTLYLKQIFKTLEVMGYPWADRLYHLAFEVVTLPGNVVLKTREGEVVLLKELLEEAVRRARALVEEKNPGLAPEVKDKVARAVALGSLKYTMLAREVNRKVTFEWERALDFQGVAAPYIQYAHVRANSILRRAGGQIPDPVTPTHELHATEVDLISQMALLPDKVLQAAREFKPLVLTNHAYELARAFNDFYNTCPVLQAEEPTRSFRLRLVAAARQALANALALLNIEAPEVM